MDLSPEAEQLLVRLVEGARTVPREEQSFYLSRYDGGDYLTGPGFTHEQIHWPDLADVQSVGLLREHGSFASGDMEFSINQEGVAKYEEIQSRGEPLETVSEQVLVMVQAEEFKRRNPNAYSSWYSAYRAWQDNPVENATRIGHDCREALMYFAAAIEREFAGGDGTATPGLPPL